MSKGREGAPKRVVRFVPTEDQREMVVKEWKTITPETQALLERLDNRSVSNAIAKRLAATAGCLLETGW